MPSLSKRLMGGWTDLHAAAAAGDIAKVRQAVQKNPSDVDKTTRDRQTALHLAAAAGFEAVVGELLDRQARTTVQDEAGRTPLHVAALAGRTACVSALLGRRNQEPPAERVRLLGIRDKEGRDALFLGVVAGHWAVVEELLRGGADPVHSADQTGAGLVLAAVQYGHVHLLPLLTPVCGLEQRHPTTGATPLHLAASLGHLPTLEWLLRAGASTTTRDNSGRTPAEFARDAGQAAAYKFLRESSTSTSASGSGGGLPPAAATAAGSDHNLYSPSAAATLPPGGLPTSAPGTVSLWGPQSPDGAAAAGVAGVWPAPVGPGRIQVPAEPPASAFYPTPPSGAGVYY